MNHHKRLNVKTGLENLHQYAPELLQGKRIGLLCNQASVDSGFTHASKIVESLFPGKLKALFSPQHGFYSDRQDNMMESAHSVHYELNIPIFSLYSNTRKPAKEMMDLIDVLIVDLQDAGCRVYTFIYTLSYCLEAAAEMNKQVIILDRPNPVGGIQVEGNIVETDCRSFVGRFPMPMRHGLTIGEIATLMNTVYNISCNLDIIPMQGWKREMYFADTGLPWIPPSPNLPKIESCMVYPGQVILEGTNLSEGRGTTLPFELFGAPFLDIFRLEHAINTKISGVHIRPVSFEPTSGKWKNQTCRGFHLHVTDREKFKPYKSSLIFLQEVIRHHKDNFKLSLPPYEYEYEKCPMDLIVGSRKIRENLIDLVDIDEMERSWQKGLNTFLDQSKPFYLYQ